MRVWLAMLTSSSAHVALGAAVVLNHFAASSSIMHARLAMEEGGGRGHGPIHATLHLPKAASAAATLQKTTSSPKLKNTKAHLSALSQAPRPMTQLAALASTPSSDGTNGLQGLGLVGAGMGRGPSLDRSSIGELDYTQDALSMRFQGQVTVDVFVNETGKVIHARLITPTGYAIDDEVVAAAQAARYTPAVSEDGRPMPAIAKLNFDFRIPGQ